MILHHEFIKTAKKYSKKIAIQDYTTDKQVPYSKALIAALILSNKFKKFKDGDIGVMIPTSAGSFLSILGILMAGKVPVMINYSTGAADNCKYAQNKCGFKTIITSKALLDKIKCPVISGMIMIEDIMAEISTKEKLTAAIRAQLPSNMIIKGLHKSDIDDNIVVLFTSGSEKDPKAVQLTHRSIGSNIQDILEAFSLGPEDIIMSILPVFHVFGLTVDFWLPLVTGMKAVTLANPLEYKKIPKIIRDEKVTMIAATPIFLAGYLRESDPGDFETVRLLVAGADKTPEWLRESFKEKHNKDILEGYGATETSPVISVNRPEANKPGSIGPLLPSVKVKITDISTGKELPRGQEGKILVKGDLVMKGYFNDLEETSLHIIDGWYDTGDMGVFDEDGFLWHRGRLKRFVKIGGEMISLVRTEMELQELLPDDVDCCIVDIPDSIKGARVIAALTKKVNEKDLIKKLSQRLSPISVPKTYVYFDELPKMGSGKVDFRTITDMVQEKLSS